MATAARASNEMHERIIFNLGFEIDGGRFTVQIPGR